MKRWKLKATIRVGKSAARRVTGRARMCSDLRALRRDLGTSGSEDLFVLPRLPYISQFASREYVSQFLDGELPVESDPKWTTFGFDTAADYAYWAPRLCGLIAVKMVFDGFGRSEQTVAQLTDEAVALGGYARRGGPDAPDRGWSYAPLVELSKRYGLQGAVLAPLTETSLVRELHRGHFIIASVHPKVIRGDLESRPTGQSGGHLVVAIGFRWRDGGCDGIFIHNPSGRVAGTQEATFVPMAQFREAFAGRGFAIWMD